MRTPLAQLAAAALLAPALLVLGSAPAHATPRTCHGQVATIVGTSNADSLNGTAGDDVIVGGARGDMINGGGGHDLICGNKGGDYLVGGSGNDAVFGQIGQDTMTGGDGDDRLDGGHGLQSSFTAGAGDDAWVSWAARDVLQFIKAPEGITVDLAAGTANGWGRDTLEMYEGAVTIFASEQADTLSGSTGNDRIYGSGGSDTVEGRAGDDYVVVDAGTVSGGDGNDYLQGIPGVSTEEGASATLLGDAGNDRLVPGLAGTASGGPGDDEIELGVNEDSRIPTPNLSLDGGDGYDSLVLQDYSRDPAGVYQQVTFDMATGSFDADALHLSAAGFEEFWARPDSESYLMATAYDITGTDGPNLIYIAETTSGTVVVHGAAGDDRILGSTADDTLVGGPGTDQADAKTGTDTCTSIENPTSCEVVEP